MIFHSYVKLPEGKVHKVSLHRSRAAGKTPVAYRGLSFKKKKSKTFRRLGSQGLMWLGGCFPKTAAIATLIETSETI